MSLGRFTEPCTDSRILKRPIMHPPISSPYAGGDHPKVVYISAKTPFISAVKRVRKLLSLIEKRSVGKVDLFNGKDSNNQKLKALDVEGSKKEKEPEEIVLKGTNRVIEKVLGLALFFQGQEDLIVRLRTGTVGVVDDIVMVPSPPNDTEGGDQKEDEKDLPETQVRKISMLEVAITLKWTQLAFGTIQGFLWRDETTSSTPRPSHNSWCFSWTRQHSRYNPNSSNSAYHLIMRTATLAKISELPRIQ